MSCACGVKAIRLQVQLHTCSLRPPRAPPSQMLSALTPSLPSMPKLLFPYKPQPRPTLATAPLRCFSALTPELKSTLDKVITSNKVVLFMKGTKELPQCGFSSTVVQILKSFNVPFETINVLENDLLRQALKEYSSWPTFPQLYLDGEFFGGCDITVEAYQSGELQELLEKTMCS
ncbi:monothiol glutaredoxin-S7, chloroplastic-like [Neltuma alba]|uniref:monothiol glutaredoxin-S7, chloroplastic-like n=1 Tax=Neltuma alba TaxID=207710 RepID=UPI0010A35CB9|nr:monothiol glutaredoxin-S7, chloroplastic-like [Prosopis alba]XP_028794152.1 monothiol glutaredoxin-S7, chloroplastic-like [Prosopis alba]